MTDIAFWYWYPIDLSRVSSYRYVSFLCFTLHSRTRFVGLLTGSMGDFMFWPNFRWANSLSESLSPKVWSKYILGSAFFEILPIIAQIFVLGAQFIQFSYTIGLCLVYWLQNTSRQNEAILPLPLDVWKLKDFRLQGGRAPLCAL